MTTATTPAATTAATLLPSLQNEARRALAALVAAPGDAAVWQSLVKVRRELASAVAMLPAGQKNGPTVESVLELLHALEQSPAASAPAAPEDLALAEALRRRNWPGLFASMLLVPAWQWPAAPALDDVQPWLWGEYTRWLFHSPKSFAAPGQAAAHAAHILRRLEELAGWAARNRGSAAVRAALQVFVQRFDATPLLLDGASLRRHFELRGKIFSAAAGLPLQEEIMAVAREGRRLRLAFVADDFGPASGTRSLLPQFAQLDPSAFEAVLFALRPAGGALEEHCRKHASALHFLPDDVSAQAAAIRATNPDVLVFASDLTRGFDGLARLALHRLAPLQIATHASPATTGLAEIDLFVSGEFDETAQAAEHYVERLGLLPGAARTYDVEADRQEAGTPWTRAMLGVPEEALLFVVAARAEKITPEMRRCWAKLLAAVPGSRLLVNPFGLDGASEQAVKGFCAEFDRVLTDNGVGTDRIIVSTNPFSSRADLDALLRLGDICLDAHPCGDADALAGLLVCGVPVVTLDGGAARSRAGAALLRAMKLGELVASDERQYHDIVLWLAGDAAVRRGVREKIEAAMARSPVILDTLAAADAFGALVGTAFDEVVNAGTFGFRMNREPVRAVSGTDVSAVESALSFGSAGEAASSAQRVLAGDPANPHVRRLLGAALLKLGRADRACAYLLEAVQHLESDAPAWSDLARAYRANGQLREATMAIQVCLGIDGKNLEALLLLAELTERTGQTAELDEIVRLVETIAPEDSRVRALVAKTRGQPAASEPASAPSSLAAFSFAPSPAAAPAPAPEMPAGLSLDSLLPADVVASLDLAQRGPAAASAVTATPSAPVPEGSRTNPRALLFFLSAKESYRQPLFSTEEIFCSPDTETKRDGGRVTALKVSPGSFDVRDVLRSLPAAQQPEIVIVKADATGRNLPRNLGALKCPKVLIVGDTHHMHRPVQSLLRYAQEEPFDFVVFDHTRHHAHFFAEAGMKNVHWLPAVDYGFVPREPKKKPAHPLTFVGQAGRHHPYRCWVLDQVKAAGLPLEMMRGTLAQTADIYADSQITLNVSLNGDLNLRVFESLAAGGFLLTDALTEDSGLPQLFQAGKHLDTWRTPGELVEKIRYFLAHPDDARLIREAGHAELLRAHHPGVKLREFYDLVFSGKVNPVYDLGRDARCARAAAKAVTAPLSASAPLVAAYESLQEMHRVSQRVTVYCAHPDELGRLADLPRLKFVPLSEISLITAAPGLSGPKAENVLWWEKAPAEKLEDHLIAFTGHVVAPEGGAAVAETLHNFGYVPVEPGGCVYRLARPARALQRSWAAGQREHVRRHLAESLAGSRESEDCLAVAHLADELQERAVKREAIDRAIGLDRNNQPALISAAAASLDEDDAGGALLALEEAARVTPLPKEAEELRAGLHEKFGRDPALAPYYAMTGRTAVPRAERPRRILMVTNLFPPQELGGYGRKMWEFAHGLAARGHTLNVLAGNLAEIAKQPTPDEVAMERCVSRDLRLLGTWTKGIPSRVTDPKEVDARRRHNIRLVKEALTASKAEFLFAGNLDFLGVDIVNVALEAGVPVLQALGNTAPGYTPAETPASPRYRIGSCSHWNAATVKNNGYPVRTEIVYPGARVDRFFRFHLPERGRLRICFAGLVMPFKGVHILVEALGRLHQAGVDFTAEIAGETTDAQFLSNLKNYAQQVGMADRIGYTGFLDRVGLSALFARSNVLVFPSLVEEGFGISQVEALAAGLVVVSTGTGGAKEIIRDGVDGLLYPSENVQALAEKLYALATDPKLFARLQGASQRRASEFAVGHSVRKIEQCMEELIATR